LILGCDLLLGRVDSHLWQVLEMLLGLVHVNMGSMSQPHHLVAAARTAEGAGFDSVWAREHIVLPDPQVPPSPMSPHDPALESLLAVTWAAAHTTTIRLATGIVIPPNAIPSCWPSRWRPSTCCPAI
jgi:Luciferase-like monooxygenase